MFHLMLKDLNTNFYPFYFLTTKESKLKYYNLMIQVDQHEGSYLSICKHYRAIYDTPCILEDSSKWQQVQGFSLKVIVCI